MYQNVCQDESKFVHMQVHTKQLTLNGQVCSEPAFQVLVEMSGE